MEDKKRNKRRFKILLICFVIILVIGSIIYFIIKPEASCYDEILNQNEQRIDCGGPCFPCVEEKTPVDLEVLGVEVVHYVDNKYDIAIRVKNQNEIFGASQMQFKVILEDENGDKITTQEEDEGYFILPREEKHLIVQGIQIDRKPSQVKVEFQEVNWKKFSQYAEPRLVILKPTYTSNPEEGGFSKITGILINNSDIDFETIKVNAILRNEEGRLLATNHQILNTVRIGEQRDFTMFFHHEFPGSVVDFKIEPETNVFDSANYLNSYGNSEEWGLESE
jgi:translation elongation factor EF-1beta